MRGRLLAALTGAIVGTLVLAAPALGATRTWNGPAGACGVFDDWSNTGCWDGGILPVSGDDVVISPSPDTDPGTYDLGADVALRSITFFPTARGFYFVDGGPIVLQSGGFITDEADHSIGDTVLGAPITLNGPATFTQKKGGDGRLAFTREISGTGGLTLVDNRSDGECGIFLVEEEAEPNSYSGTTTVSGSGRVCAGAVGIPTNGALVVNGAIDFGDIFGEVDSITIGSLAGSGEVRSDGYTPLEVGGDNTSTTFSGVYREVFEGASELVKQGTGTMTLAGANTYSGATTVSAGTLSVTGSTVSATTVASGATLKGTGAIDGPVTLSSGATLAPGTSVATLSTGSLTLGAGSTFAAEIDGGGADRVNVAGTVSLGGATLNLTLLAGYTHTPGTVYKIIANDGADPVLGTFSGLAEGATVTVGGNPFRVSYAGGDGNDVTLTVPAAITPAAVYRDLVLGACGPTGPRGYWRLGEAPGATIADDASPFGHDGTYRNGTTATSGPPGAGPQLGRPGAIAGDPDTAARLAAATNSIRVPHASTLNVGDKLTLEAWVKRSSTDQNQTIFSKGGNAYQLVVMKAADGNRVWFRKANVTTIAKSSVGIGADDRYHHVVVTKNGPGSTTIYIDGTNVTVPVSPGQVLANTTEPLLLAAPATGATLDELAIYPCALGPDEVLDHTALGP